MEGRKYNARGKQIEEIFWGQSILQDGVGNFAAHDYPEWIYKFCKFAWQYYGGSHRYRTDVGCGNCQPAFYGF